MTVEFVKALDQEIAAIENELRADLRYAKLDELKRLRANFYSAAPINSKPNQSSDAADQRGRKPSPDRDRILAAVEGYVRGSGEDPLPTVSIHELLTENGIVIGGEKPINNLSAMISNSRRFKAHGRRGWTLLRDGELPDGSEPASADPENVAHYTEEDTESWDAKSHSH